MYGGPITTKMLKELNSEGNKIPNPSTLTSYFISKVHLSHYKDL